MRTIHRVLLVSAASLAVAASAWAQVAPRVDDWHHATTVSGFAGAAVASSSTGSMLGGTAGWEITPALAIEGSGAWASFDHGASGFSGALQVRRRLGGRRSIDPFVQAGVGVYRASFGPDDSVMPDFYRQRVTRRISEMGTTFHDPTVLAGGGLSVFISRHVAVRPVVQALVAFRDRRHLVMTSVAVHAVYHFENHPVTPVRGR
jgi:hypothetical protein